MKWPGWRAVNNPKPWFYHPRAFWSNEPMNQYRLTLRQRWHLAIHDPIYVGLWATLITIVGLTLWAVL